MSTLKPLAQSFYDELAAISDGTRQLAYRIARDSGMPASPMTTILGPSVAIVYRDPEAFTAALHHLDIPVDEVVIDADSQFARAEYRVNHLVKIDLSIHVDDVAPPGPEHPHRVSRELERHHRALAEAA